MAKQDTKVAEQVEAALLQHNMGKRLVKVKAARGEGDPLAGWATSLAVPLGAMVRTLVVLVGETSALMLIAGDRQALVANVPRALNLQGEAGIATGDETLAVSGFASGTVPPVGLAQARAGRAGPQPQAFCHRVLPGGAARPAVLGDG